MYLHIQYTSAHAPRKGKSSHCKTYAYSASLNVTGVTNDIFLGASDAVMAVSKGSDNKPTILVCDDDAMQRLLIRQCLETENMSVIEAADGYEALEAFGSQRPDLIFMDVDMPGISGI